MQVLSVELSPAEILSTNNLNFFPWYFHIERKIEKSAAILHCLQTIGLVRQMNQTTFETENVPWITTSQQ